MTLARLGWRLAASVFLAAFAMSAPAKVPTSALSGIFGSVQMGPETGDLGGLEIELHPEAASPYALVVFCEGWCNQAHLVSLKVNGSRFSLAFSEPLVDEDGKPVAADQFRIDGQARGNSLLVDFQLNSYRERMRLKRLARRFGLDVAEPPAGETN